MGYYTLFSPDIQVFFTNFGKTGAAATAQPRLNSKREAF
jgi:hypothetical protein